MKYPLISVIIPTFNRAYLLYRAIKSVLQQTYKNLEIIIVDDGSKDNTEEIIRNISDKRIKYVKHSKNKGLSASRNTGILISTGEFIAFLDDDDEYKDSKIEKQLKKFYFASEDVGIIYCGIVNIKDGKIMYAYNPKDLFVNKNTCLLPHPIGWQLITGLIRRECFEKVGLFDETLVQREDWDMIIRLSAQYRFDFVPEFLYIRHIHGNQMMTNLIERIKGREMVIQKHKKRFQSYPFALSWQYRLLGSLYCINDDILMARKYFFKSIKVYPSNIGSYIHIFLTFLSHSLHKKVIQKIAFKKIGNRFLYY